MTADASQEVGDEQSEKPKKLAEKIRETEQIVAEKVKEQTTAK